VIDVTGVSGSRTWLGPGKAHESETLDAADEATTEIDPKSLITREANFYILGAKRSGGDPHFPFERGLQQIRALFSIIGGRAELDLYASVKNLLP
jgi:hypothetical protein